MRSSIADKMSKNHQLPVPTAGKVGTLSIYARIIRVVPLVRKLDTSPAPIYVRNTSKITLMKLKLFDGKENVLSNFFPCELMVFGESKAVRAGDLLAAERIRAAKSALECKQIGNSVLPSTSWHQDAPKVMEEIVIEKVKQISEM